MMHIHDKELNKIAEWNLLHDIINPTKRTQKNSHYSPIINVCMNTRHYRVKYKKFWIILDCGCSSTIVTGRVSEKYIL